MRELPKGSGHALISQGAEECLYRQFGLLFGLGVGTQSERCLEFGTL